VIRVDRTPSAGRPTPDLVFEPEPEGGPVVLVKSHRVYDLSAGEPTGEHLLPAEALVEER
jgi:hypothetical protein